MNFLKPSSPRCLRSLSKSLGSGDISITVAPETPKSACLRILIIDSTSEGLPDFKSFTVNSLLRLALALKSRKRSCLANQRNTGSSSVRFSAIALERYSMFGSVRFSISRLRGKPAGDSGLKRYVFSSGDQSRIYQSRSLPLGNERNDSCQIRSRVAATRYS